ncbi:MAG: hypothetical protein ACREQ5_06740 [Candidatus Dormibacteria bacterium]
MAGRSDRTSIFPRKYKRMWALMSMDDLASGWQPTDPKASNEVKANALTLDEHINRTRHVTKRLFIDAYKHEIRVKQQRTGSSFEGGENVDEATQTALTKANAPKD